MNVIAASCFDRVGAITPCMTIMMPINVEEVFSEASGNALSVLRQGSARAGRTSCPFRLSSPVSFRGGAACEVKTF